MIFTDIIHKARKAVKWLAALGKPWREMSSKCGNLLTASDKIRIFAMVLLAQSIKEGGYGR
jgi:hypothetical protein